MTHITDNPGPPDPDFEEPLEVLTPGPDLPLPPPRFLLASFCFVAGCMLVAGIFLLLGILFGTLVTLLLFVFYGWMLFTFLNYRYSRQEELLQLLTTAVQARAPLAPALRAYLHDRPCGTLRELWVGTLLFFVLPGYYWIWHLRHNFDRKIARVAHLLEQGFDLDQALLATPGVVPREAVLAAAIGQSTGELALCLRNSARSQLNNIWMEVLPRILYPVGLLLFITGITAFWMIFIGPRIVRIFKDFKEELPWQTATLMNGWGGLMGQNWAVVFAFMLVSGLIILVIASPTVRWYCPGVGRFYRRGVQSKLMKMLSVLLDAGKTLPQALEVLTDSGYFPEAVNRRLDDACEQVEQGEPWTDSLRRVGLLPASVVPLLHAAERVHNLPWALAEVGESQATRTFRLLHRLTLVFSPAIICGVGLLVGFIVYGMFIPLTHLITKMSQ